MINFVGIDLSASEKNPTGLCILSNVVECFTVHTDDEILEIVLKRKPKVIAIDSPLTFELPYRKAEKELYKRGFRPLPLSIESMKRLYKRAIKIKENLRDFSIIETFPRAIEKILGFSYGRFKNIFRNKHEYDAWLCSITAKMYYYKKYEDIYGIILPKLPFHRDISLSNNL